MPFSFKRLEIPEVIEIEPPVFRDGRGYFSEMYKRSDFAAAGISEVFGQDNISRSVRGVLRGLHYQLPPKAQAKLVRVLQGEIFDVAVDVRKGSPTFGRFVAAVLSADSMKMLYIPEGFAHGFCVLSGTADFLYKVSGEYSREHEGGILWNDPKIGIPWPVQDPAVSEKDGRLPLLENAQTLFNYIPLKKEIR